VQSNSRIFFERFNRMVIGRARNLLGDGDDAQDAMQEVFLRVLSTESRLLDDPAPHGWLHRVTTNICFNRLRDVRRRRELLAAAYAEYDRDERTPEPRAILRQLLGVLPDDVQVVALHHYLDEMTYEEIARRVGVSTRTVGTRLSIFRRRLARLDAGE
jgi:RNA polymerase sigma factor (sigma-70 family)